jgi:hypothetical protein
MGDDRVELSVVISQSLAAADAETVDAGERVASRPPGIRSRLLSLFRRSPAVTIAGCIAVLSAVAYLMAAPMGRDVSRSSLQGWATKAVWRRGIVESKRDLGWVTPVLSQAEGGYFFQIFDSGRAACARPRGGSS